MVTYKKPTNRTISFGRCNVRAFHKKVSSGSCDESCGYFADEIMITVSTFSHLEWLKRLPSAPQAAPSQEPLELGAAGAAMRKGGFCQTLDQRFAGAVVLAC